MNPIKVKNPEGFNTAFSMLFRPMRSTIFKVFRVTSLKLSLAKDLLEKSNIKAIPKKMEHPSITGVILAGGASSRMKKNKSLINYHGIPQWEYAAHQLKSLNLPVLISSNTPLKGAFKVIPDSAEWFGHGPISGLLSVAGDDPRTALLVLGVDYPLISVAALFDLLDTFQDRKTSVCFRNPDSGRIEPLIALYHPRHIQMIQQGFLQGQFSLTRFWEENPLEVVILDHIAAEQLKSFDLPENETSFRTH